MKIIFILATFLVLPCASAIANDSSIAFVGATIIDGTEREPLENGVIVITNGRIQSVGRRSDVGIPDGTEVIDATGKTIIPGLVDAHAHVGDVIGLEGGHYTKENLIRQLRLYANYGVTTVNSLGGDGAEGFALRNNQNSSDLNRARIMVAGSVVSGETQEAIRAEVNHNADMGADFIKVRVDDNLGNSTKMTRPNFDTLLDQANARRLPLAVHLFYLDDAKYILNAGAELVAHSIRDQMVDQEFIDLIKAQNKCYIPTLTREVSTFVYESEPAFFNDPYFLKAVDPTVLDELRDPERQQRVKNSRSAQGYKKGLEVAMKNIGVLHRGGVKIAMGTDTGVAARFQGYFNHMEMHMMVDAGMSPIDVIRASTGVAADCIGAGDVGTLIPGKWGDLVILNKNPVEDIKNTTSIESVWVAGNKMKD